VEMLRERETAHAMAARAGRLVRNEFGLELTADRYAEAYVAAIDRAPMYGDNTGTESRTSFQQVGP
jgi:hypothetical protein